MNNPVDNPAIEHMETARAQLREFTAYLKEANECLQKASQAIERANENTIVLDCPTRKKLQEELGHRFAALRFGIGTTQKVLEAPILQRMIAQDE